MFDLEEQVREYVEFLDQQTQRVAAGAAVERASRTPRSTWLRRPALVFGAAILVVAVVGMVVGDRAPIEARASPVCRRRALSAPAPPRARRPPGRGLLRRHAHRQTQRIEHELHRQFVIAHPSLTGQGALRRRAEVGRRLTLLAATLHAIMRHRQLAVRTGANAQVIAESPVVEVVATQSIVSCIGRDLILAVATGRQDLLAPLHHFDPFVFVG